MTADTSALRTNVPQPARRRSTNILVRAQTGASYSGGRLLAWILAEAFAHNGDQVTFWGGEVPLFVRDFVGYPRHASIRFHSGPQPPEHLAAPFDLVVVVPHMGHPTSFYPQILAVAAQHGARVALLNFETPNWFNEMSPEPRDPQLWNGWRQIAREADVILSMTREGTRYARAFYSDVGPTCQFANVSPAINSLVADQATAETGPQVMCITRFALGNAHKGASGLRAILGPHFAGHTLVVVAGGGMKDEALTRDLAAESERHGATLRVLQNISDFEKFTELKRSKLLVFPSFFEGFGYPPVEALYCNVPCIAYDLPVLREVGGAGITFVPMGNAEMLRSAVTQALSANAPARRDLRSIVESSVGFDAFTANLSRVLSPLLLRERRRYPTMAAARWAAEARLRSVGDTLGNKFVGLRWRLTRLHASRKSVGPVAETVYARPRETQTFQDAR